MLTSHKISSFPAQAATRQSVAAQVPSPRACVPAPANDDVADYLDRELTNLPLDFSDVPPVPVVTDLDGFPAELEPAPVPVPDLVTRAAPRSRRKQRRSGLRQREDARRMRAHSRAGFGEVVNHLLTPASNNTNTSTTASSKGRTRRIAAWDDAGDLPRVVAMNRALDRFGVPMAFSVNFDPKLIRAGNDNARGQLDYYRRRIALALKRALGEALTMWIAVETADDGRQHCHGGMALTDRHDPAAALDALARAGGNWTTQGSAPADLRPQHDPDGWAVYPFKRAPRTRRDLRKAAGLDADARVTLHSCTDDLRIEAKRVYEEARRVIGSGNRTRERDRTAREIVQEARQRTATLEAPETAPVLPEPPCEPAGIPEPASAADAGDRAELAWAEIRAGLAFTAPTLSALDGPFRTPTTARSRGPPSRACRPSAGPDPPLASCPAHCRDPCHTAHADLKERAMLDDALDFPTLPAVRSAADFHARLREQRRRERCIIATFIGAAATGDTPLFNRALGRATEFSVLGRCLGALVRSGQVHDAVRAEFHITVKTYGDGLRQELRHDLDLVKSLRLLLPPYQGNEIIVFRGDSAFNRRRRTYGLSWTTDRGVADSFARGEWCNCEGGSVLLRAVAPPAAILWTCPPDDDPYSEAEVMVDRRYLRDIRVLQRFSQASEVA